MQIEEGVHPWRIIPSEISVILYSLRKPNSLCYCFIIRSKLMLSVELSSCYVFRHTNY